MESANRKRNTRASADNGGENCVETGGTLGRGAGGDGDELPSESATRKGRSRRQEPSENQECEVAVETIDEFTPEQILTDMGMELNQNIEQKGKVFAWRTYQKRLMEYSGRLSSLMSAKEIQETYWQIEKDLKSETGGGQQGTPLDECREFLNGPKIKPKVGRPEKVH